MPQAQEVLKQALPYLTNDTVRAEFKEFANALVRDLEEAGFEQSDEMEEFSNRLSDMLNDIDESTADKEAELKDLAVEGRELVEDEPSSE